MSPSASGGAGGGCAIAAGGNRLFDPGEEIGLTAARICARRAWRCRNRAAATSDRSDAPGCRHMSVEASRRSRHQRIGAIRQVGEFRMRVSGEPPGMPVAPVVSNGKSCGSRP